MSRESIASQRAPKEKSSARCHGNKLGCCELSSGKEPVLLSLYITIIYNNISVAGFPTATRNSNAGCRENSRSCERFPSLTLSRLNRGRSRSLLYVSFSKLRGLEEFRTLGRVQNSLQKIYTLAQPRQSITLPVRLWHLRLEASNCRRIFRSRNEAESAGAH